MTDTLAADQFVGDLETRFKELQGRLAFLEGQEGGLGYIHLEDRKALNTNGGTFTSGADQTRDLNTEVVDIGNHCSLAGNQFTLDAGTYEILAFAPAFDIDRHQAWLYNVTAGATTLAGLSSFASSAFDGASHSVIMGRFSITAQTTFEIRHRCETTRATFGFGVAGNFASAGTEVYTQVYLQKVA